MKTQTFKAKDVKSAINLVNDEFGQKAIILSTKKNNGFVEIEASDNENIIKDHKKLKEDKNTFSKTFLKHLESKNSKKIVEDNISYLNTLLNRKISQIIYLKNILNLTSSIKIFVFLNYLGKFS